MVSPWLGLLNRDGERLLAAGGNGVSLGLPAGKVTILKRDEELGVGSGERLKISRCGF